MKKKKLWIIVGISFFLMVLIVSTIIVASDYQKEQKAKNKIKTFKEEQTITCTAENARDDVTITEEVYLQKGELITRVNTYEWHKSVPKETTCTYYKDMASGLNGKSGVTSTTTCDASSGRNTTTYIINEVDKEDIRLKQFDYIVSDNKFDYQSWKIFMEKDGYHCEER